MKKLVATPITNTIWWATVKKDRLLAEVGVSDRVEWRAVGGNPACRGYDNFIKRHNGNKHILKDCIKDRNGNYHDDIIYEIV